MLTKCTNWDFIESIEDPDLKYLYTHSLMPFDEMLPNTDAVKLWGCRGGSTDATCSILYGYTKSPLTNGLSTIEKFD